MFGHCKIYLLMYLLRYTLLLDPLRTGVHLPALLDLGGSKPDLQVHAAPHLLHLLTGAALLDKKYIYICTSPRRS